MDYSQKLAGISSYDSMLLGLGGKKQSWACEKHYHLLSSGAGTRVGKQVCFYGALLSLSLSAATGGFEALPLRPLMHMPRKVTYPVLSLWWPCAAAALRPLSNGIPASSPPR